MSKITINGVTFNPSSPQPVIASPRLLAPDSSDSDYILIQTDQALSKDQKAELSNLGVSILEYVPDDTYLCHFSNDDLEPIRNLNFIQWANTYMRGFKIAPSLMPGINAAPAGTRSLSEMATATENSLATAPKQVDVVFHADVDPKSLQDKLAKAAYLDAGDLNIMPHKMRLNVQAKYLADLADVDEIRHIEEVLPMKLHNNIAREILNLEPPPGNPGGPYHGNGQIVAVADTGFDNGSLGNVHDAFTGRVNQLYALGRTTANDPDGHGTHVAGSVLGDGNSTTLGHTVQGSAPQAELVLQSVLDNSGGLGGLPVDLNDLFEPPYNNDGARIHTNSWGSILGDGRYNSNSREVDEFVWNNRDCVICFAAGNEGVDANASGDIDPKSITPPGTAKNCITIGATENNRPTFQLDYQSAFGYPANPIASDSMANNSEGMVAFSSRGPTVDGRIKPDVVAPGSYILSARSRATSGNGWASSPDPLYYYMGGTSMATPLVAGCVAVVREYLAAAHGMANPSAALIKAAIINGARDVTGQYVPSEAAGIPNNSEGFGLVDMSQTLSDSVQFHDEGNALDSGDEEVVAVAVGANASLKVTLVWTDPPGSTLQNDLDLVVSTANGEERHGNVAPSSAAFDRVNNVEQVVWNNMSAGNVDVLVRAHRIPVSPQTYALVIRVD